MFKLSKYLLMVFLWSAISNTQSLAATKSVDCSSSTTVQIALNNASSGDTVICSTTGSYTWSTVTMPNNKNITLNGNGSTIATTAVNGAIVLSSSASYWDRVTNFTFVSANEINTPSIIGSPGEALTNAPWRLDHCTFNAASVSSTMMATGMGPGLIDHCTFINIPVALETIHNAGWGPGDVTGWDDAAPPGSPQALYLEDNTITAAQGNSSCLMQNYYGARVVARFNTLNSAMIDAHGNTTGYSTRWWELYNNTLSNGSTFCLRGGSGLIFDNSGDSSNQACFVDETSNDAYGIGYGQNGLENTPAYLWNNGSMSYLYNQDCCSVHDGTVNVGVDVIVAGSGTFANRPSTCTINQGYWATDQGSWNQSGSGGQGVLYKCTATNTWTLYYTPYTYPHPLQGGGSIPAAPTGLTVQ